MTGGVAIKDIIGGFSTDPTGYRQRSGAIRNSRGHTVRVNRPTGDLSGVVPLDE